MKNVFVFTAFSVVATANISVTGLSPAGGSTGGGTRVTVTGSGFTPQVIVRFADQTASNLTVVSSTTLLATTPPGPPGVVGVTVSGAGGLSGALPHAYTYSAPPSLSRVTPGSGPSAGGTTVALTGMNFRSGAKVSFGGTASTLVVVQNSSNLTAAVPRNGTGTVAVTVTNPDGQSALLTNGYAYVSAAAIASLVPARGTITGGTAVTIAGSGFAAGARVTFGGLPASSVQIVNSTRIQALTPAAANIAGGPVPVVVANIAGDSASSSFDYIGSQAVTSVSPGTGPPSGGIPVVISGSGFGPSTQILFGLNTAGGVTLTNSTRITCTLPAGSGTVNVSAFTPGFGTAYLPNAFRYVQVLSLSAVSPAIGPASGGNQVTITGAGFLSGATVTLGAGQPQRTAFQNSTTLTVTLPASPTGTVSVKVINPQGSQASLPGAYTFTNGPAVWNISPSSGSTGGGTAITLSGANLGNLTQVLFGSQRAGILSATINSATVALPPNPSSIPVSVTVKNPYGSQTIPQGFTYLSLGIATEGLDDGYPGIPYKVGFTTNGAGSPPYTWRISAGSLPPGLALSPTSGLLSGAPTGPANASPYSFTVAAADSASPPNRVQKPFHLNVLYGFNPGVIPASYFGMTLNDPADWPLQPPHGAGVQIGALGKGLAVTWPFIEQSHGVFNWSRLDQYAQAAQTHSIDLFFTNFNFPAWAVPDSSNPANCGAYANTFPPVIACSNMVADLQSWKDFNTALVTRYKGKIHMYELYNEPNSPGSFTGTVAQMVELTNAFHDIVRAVDSTALIGTPSASAGYFGQYLNAGGTVDVDTITLHEYPNVSVSDQPEFVLTRLDGTKQVTLTTGNLARLPLWDTETGWGNNAFAIADPQQRAAFVARYLLLQWSAGIARAYWYAWDEPNWGTLFNEVSAGVGDTSPAAFAYRQVQTWMQGASMPAPCTANGGEQYSATYTCDLVRTGGYQARAVWNASLVCNNNTCQSTPYNPDRQYIQYRDIEGNIHRISPGQKISISAKPVLLENLANP